MPIDVPESSAAPSGMANSLRAMLLGRILLLQVLCLFGGFRSSGAAATQLPLNAPIALSGSGIAAKVRSLDRDNREDFLVNEILMGNVPESWRRFVEVTVTRTNAGKVHRLTMAVAPDYLTVGTDADGWMTPLSPQAAERIAFLDSNYAYDSAKGHADKLATWLKGGTNRVLAVLAYHDSIALLNGKTFVSKAGGTWGRSHAMVKDLDEWFALAKAEDAEWENFSGLEGRVRFLLRKNPKKEILHTRQVEWNGLIHATAVNTPMEDAGYRYFGPRAYEKWISEWDVGHGE